MNLAIYKQKKFYIPAIIVFALIIFRILLPEILLKQANKFLGDFSPTYSLHMEDLDISILRGAYRFEKIKGQLKGKDDRVFLKINYVDVSMARREIFKGKIVTDIITDNADVLFLKDMSNLSPPKEEAKDVKETLFPVKVESVELVNAKVVFEEYPSLTENQRLRIEDINGKITNLTPDKKDKLSEFNLHAALQGSTPTMFKGSLNIYDTPMLWDVDVQLKKFDMATLNPVLKRNLPLTFTRGKLDLYAEMQNDKKGVIKGYVKPFIVDLDVVANKEKFVGIKHFAIEVVTALGNLIIRDKNKTVATEIDFTYDKEFKVDKDKSIDKALENGFKKPLKRGIANKYQMEDK